MATAVAQTPAVDKDEVVACGVRYTRSSTLPP